MLHDGFAHFFKLRIILSSKSFLPIISIFQCVKISIFFIAIYEFSFVKWLSSFENKLNYNL